MQVETCSKSKLNIPDGSIRHVQSEQWRQMKDINLRCSGIGLKHYKKVSLLFASKVLPWEYEQ